MDTRPASRSLATSGKRSRSGNSALVVSIISLGIPNFYIISICYPLMQRLILGTRGHRAQELDSGKTTRPSRILRKSRSSLRRWPSCRTRCAAMPPLPSTRTRSTVIEILDSEPSHICGVCGHLREDLLNSLKLHFSKNTSGFPLGRFVSQRNSGHERRFIHGENGKGFLVEMSYPRLEGR